MHRPIAAIILAVASLSGPQEAQSSASERGTANSLQEASIARLPPGQSMPMPDGGIPVALLGLGLASLGVGRRFLRKLH